MTPEEFAEQMKAIVKKSQGDQENDHIDADNLMCKALREAGYGEGVDFYSQLPKWYA